jgi:hypothetical protein
LIPGPERRMVLAQDSRRPTSEGWLPSMDRCVGAAVLEPTRTRARRTGGRGIVRGWGDAIQAGLNHAAPAGSSTGIAARSSNRTRTTSLSTWSPWGRSIRHVLRWAILLCVGGLKFSRAAAA